jgi:hypothetical protein
MSASSCVRIDPPSGESPDRTSAASRARIGHSPPARSATASRGRGLASATYEVRAELAEMQDIDDWCPQDDLTGVRIVTDIALMLALTQALPTSVALACLRRIILEIDQSVDREHGVVSRSPCHHRSPTRLDSLP